MIFTCPHCHKSATLCYSRTSLIIGCVLEVSLEEDGDVVCTMTEDDDEAEQYDGHFICGECAFEIPTEVVRALYDKEED